MHRFISLLAAALLALSPALASADQLMLLGVGAPAVSGGGGGGYTGPGDVIGTAPTAFYGFRAYNATKASTNVKLVALKNGTATCDLLAATTGGPGVTANCAGGGTNGQSLATFCNTTCTITTWYDQIRLSGGTGGNANDLVTISLDPTNSNSCINSLPCTVFAGANGLWAFNAGTTNAQPYSFSTVAIRTSGTAQASIIGEISNPSVAFFDANGGTGNKVGGFFGATGTAQAATDNVWHSLQFVVSDATSSTIKVDGAAPVTVTFGTNNLARWYVGLDGPGPNDPLTGKMAEMAVWLGTAISSGDQTALCHNRDAYYSLGIGC